MVARCYGLRTTVFSNGGIVSRKRTEAGLVGGSDAHKKDDVGSVFTVVAANRLTAGTIIRRSGHTYVSDEVKLIFEVPAAVRGRLKLRSDTPPLLVEVAVDLLEPARLDSFITKR